MLLFKLETIRSCPITRESQGKIMLKAWIVQAIRDCLAKEAGEEWLVLLTGTRSQDGLIINCDGVLVPSNQVRSTGNVRIDEIDTSEDVVCVLHSHHSMGAFFSGTDDSKLNPRFASSIVVSTKIESIDGVHLGFGYKAEGRVLLPCGQLGIIPYLVEVEDIESWPRNEHKGLATHESLAYASRLDGCNKQIPVGSGIYWQQNGTQCGVKQDIEVAVTPQLIIPKEQERDISAELPPALGFGNIYGQGGVYIYKGGALERVSDKSPSQTPKETVSPRDSRSYEDYEDYEDYTHGIGGYWTGRSRYNNRSLDSVEKEKGGLEKVYGNGDEVWDEEGRFVGLGRDIDLEKAADRLLEEEEEFRQRKLTIAWERLMEREEAFLRANPGVGMSTDSYQELFEDWLKEEQAKVETEYDMELICGSEKD